VNVNKFVCALNMKTWGVWASGGTAPRILTSALYHCTVMSGLFHAPASLPQGESRHAYIEYEDT
jgi:hypothetical protein